MATLKLTIYKHKDLLQDIVLDSSSLTAKYKFKDATSIEHDYLFTLVGLDVSMQMYRPSEILADISIAMTSGNDWVAIPRTCFEIFKDKRIGLSSGSYEIGNDFYVHEVIPECYSDSMHLKLKIYSPDKMLTLRNTSRTFVGKRLSEILTSELGKYRHPAVENDSLKFNTDHLQVLKFKVEKGEIEHMFPFLVQYNESIYDLLARTANRWGEFMYYRDGKLHFGYNANQKAIGFEEITKDKKKKVKYYKATFPSYNTDAVLTNGDASGVYDLQAVYDETVSDTPVEKSPYMVKGELGKFNGAEDKYLMKKAASFLGNDKDVVTWLFNNLVDDSVSVAQSVAYKAQLNDDLNKKYFSNKEKYPVQYGRKDFTLYDDVKEEKDAFNEFTEFNSAYNATKYQMILEAERTASKNLVQIDFDTTSPDVKLGDLIIVDGEQFIVVGVTSKTIKKIEKFIADDESIKTKVETWQNFVVTAVGRKDSSSIFYPTMLPSGHVKYSGPQKATIWYEDDPTLNNRVRVLFDWQLVTEEDKEKKTKETKPKDEDTVASPWLVFAAKGDGNPSTGRHVKKTEVLVGFVGGNIERPYVMGAIQKKAGYDTTIDVNLDTDKGHFLRLTDGSRGGGLSSFLFGALSPAASTIANFVPEFAFNAGKSDRLEGGFSLGDYFGIYKISGSSDQRNITISSPWGDVKMNAFTGITISAPNGDVKISGKNVTIEAGNNLKLLSGTNVDYKFYQDKKYKGTSPATVLMSASAAIVSRLAKKFTMLDLSIVRSVVEIVMRPVEGALTVKSSRFLKLEAGKNACEYPVSAFNVDKRQKLVGDAVGKSLKKNSSLSEGLVRLFEQLPVQARHFQETYNTRYNNCVDKKRGLLDAIDRLKMYSEDPSKKPSKDYEGLKSVLWDSDVKKQKIEEKDLGFSEDLVGAKNDAKTDKVLMRNPSWAKVDVILHRAALRVKIVQKATELRQAIIEVLKTDSVENLAVEISKKTSKTPPKDAGKNLYEATCKKNHPDLPVYKVTDVTKSLSIKNPIRANELKLISRAFTLKMLDLYKLTEGTHKPTVTNAHATGAGNIMHDLTWLDFVNELKVEDADTLMNKKTDFDKWKDDMKGAFDTVLGDINPDTLSRIKTAWDERHSWDNNNNGSILFGANNQTYQLGEGENPQMQKVEKIKPLIPEGASREFLKELRKNLKQI